MWKNEKEKKNNAKNEKKNMAFIAITGMMLKKTKKKKRIVLWLPAL
jgi:hypothetical protein